MLGLRLSEFLPLGDFHMSACMIFVLCAAHARRPLRHAALASTAALLQIIERTFLPLGPYLAMVI